MAGFLTVEHTEDCRHTLGEWQDYSVRWLTTSPAALPSLGDGRLTGRYTRIGNTVHLRIELAIGATTSVGTGAWLFTLPATHAGPVTADNPLPIGIAYSNLGHGMAMVGTGDAPCFAIDAGGNFFSNLTPNTWTAGSKFVLIATYEAAPLQRS
jgi:hypothetical protein